MFPFARDGQAGASVFRSIRLAICAYLYVSVFALLFFRAPILERRPFYVWDHALVYLPMHVYNARLRAAGELPLWNRHSFLGYPLQAENELSGVYPPSLIFNLLEEPGFAYTVFIVFHHLLAAMGTMYLLRVLMVGVLGQTAAALIFAFGGTFVGHSYSLSLVTTFAWAPLILGLQLRAFELPSCAHAVMAGIAFAMQTSGAHPQVSLFTMLMMLAAVLCRFRPWRRLLASIKITSLILVIGLGLSAPQVFYCLRLMATTVRWSGLSEELPVSHSLPPQYLIQGLLPNLHGFDPGNFFFFHETRFYFGLLALGLIVLGWRSAGEHVRLFRMLLVVSLLLALGRFAGVYPLLSALPGFRQVHSPQRFVMVMSLAAAVLAGLGLDRLLKHGLGTRRQRRVLVRGYSCLTFVALVCGGFVLLTGELSLANYQWFVTLGVNLRIIVDAAMLQGFGQSALIAAALSALCAVYWHVLPGRRGVGLVAVGLLSMDLFVCNDPVNRYGPPDYYARVPQVVSLLKADSGKHGLWRLAANHDVGFDFLNPDLARLPSNVPALFGIDALNWNPGAKRKDLETFFGDFSNPARNLTMKELGVFNVKYLLLPFDVPKLDDHLLYRDGRWLLYENPLWQPRVAIREHVIVSSTRDTLKSRLNSSDFDLDTSVVLEEPPEFTRGVTEDNVPGQAEVEVTGYSAHRVSIDVILPRPAVLVLSDLYDPGWRATCNGRAIQILVANGFVRGLALGPGRHQIEFDYHPRSFYYGLIVTAATVAVLLAWGLVLGNRKLSRRAIPP